MKRRIVLEHRQALDEMEAAKSKHRSCKDKKKCDNGNGCIVCPAALNYQAKKAVFDVKVAALNKLNEQAIERQRNKVLIKINERTKEGTEILVKEPKPPLYKREDLTVKRYQRHREVDELKDREIREMYGFPTSSFDKWKRDNNLVQKNQQQKGDNMTTQKTVNSKEDSAYKQQYEQVKTEYDALLENHLKAQQELEAANAESAKRMEKMTHLEAELDSLKEVNIGLKTERDVFEAESNQYKQQIASQAETIERLQADLAALIEESDNDAMEAIERQFQRFDQWETMMLERLLQMKKAN